MEHEHTEPDASYTRIIIPNRIQLPELNEASNKTKFEFLINKDEILVVSMHPGTIMSYSGYMLTHREQIINLDELSLPFLNLVAYDSK